MASVVATLRQLHAIVMAAQRQRHAQRQASKPAGAKSCTSRTIFFIFVAVNNVQRPNRQNPEYPVGKLQSL